MTYQVLFRLHVLRFTIEPYNASAWTIFSIGVLGPLLFYTTWRGRQQRQHQIDEGGQNANSNWQMWALDPERSASGRQLTAPKPVWFLGVARGYWCTLSTPGTVC